MPEFAAVPGEIPWIGEQGIFAPLQGILRRQQGILENDREHLKFLLNPSDLGREIPRVTRAPKFLLLRRDVFFDFAARELHLHAGNGKHPLPPDTLAMMSETQSIKLPAIVPGVIIELLKEFGANTDPKLLTELFAPDAVVLVALTQLFGEEANAAMRNGPILDLDFARRLVQSEPFKRLCKRGIRAVDLHAYCARFRALAALEDLMVHGPELRRVLDHLEQALIELDGLPLAVVRRSAPRSIAADLLALKNMVRYVLDVQKGPFGIKQNRRGRPQKSSHTNFMMRTVEVIPPNLWARGVRFQKQFAELHEIVFGVHIEPKSYTRELARHYKRAVLKAKEVIKSGRVRGRANMPTPNPQG